jgi:hypothetical protein
MSNDLSIRTTPAAPLSGEEPALNPRLSLSGASVSGPAIAATEPVPNPTLELDAALGLVVIQFRNDSGAVTNSIPSQQQLDAYRLWQEARVGPPPNLGAATPPPGPALSPPPVATAPPSPAAAGVPAVAPPDTGGGDLTPR